MKRNPGVGILCQASFARLNRPPTEIQPDDSGRLRRQGEGDRAPTAPQIQHPLTVHRTDQTVHHSYPIPLKRALEVDQMTRRLEIRGLVVEPLVDPGGIHRLVLALSVAYSDDATVWPAEW